jgi:hypothetical protein
VAGRLMGFKKIESSESNQNFCLANSETDVAHLPVQVHVPAVMYSKLQTKLSILTILCCWTYEYFSYSSRWSGPRSYFRVAAVLGYL